MHVNKKIKSSEARIAVYTEKALVHALQMFDPPLKFIVARDHCDVTRLNLYYRLNTKKWMHVKKSLRSKQSLCAT